MFLIKMDQRELSIVSHNCKGIKNSYKDVQNLCDLSDIVFLQETWRTQQNLVFLQTVCSAHNSYGFSPVNESVLQETWLTQQNLVFLQTISCAHYSYCFSPVNESEGVRKGRPYSGTVILWKKDLQAERVVNHTSEIIGLKLTSLTDSVAFINVYFPYCCYENQDDFDSYLGQLESFYKSINVSKIYILGDFNASKTNAFGPLLNDFCMENDLILSDELL